MVALIASLENGTYKGGTQGSSDQMTVEELTELRLKGNIPNRNKKEFYTEPTDVKWTSIKKVVPIK